MVGRPVNRIVSRQMQVIILVFGEGRERRNGGIIRTGISYHVHRQIRQAAGFFNGAGRPVAGLGNRDPVVFDR